MRIAFVNVNAKVTGGAEESLALLARHLPPPFEPVIVSFEDGPFVDVFRRAGIQVQIHNIGTEIRQTRRDGSWFGGLLHTPTEIRSLARTLGSLDVDLVHTDTMKGHVLGISAGRLLGIPTMLHLRDILNGNARILLRTLATQIATDVVPVSRAVANWYGMPISKVVHNPLDLEAYTSLMSPSDARKALDLPQDVPIVGIVGRINRWKGHDRFLRIISKIPSSTPFHAVIVGEARFRDHDFVPELHAQVDSLNLNARVTFVPWQSDPRVAYAALDVNANCSTREPFGRAILEAAACGVPSVCFDDGAFGELFETGDVGFEIPSGDEDAFAAAITKLIMQPKSLPIIKRIQRFSVEAHVGDIAQRMRVCAAKHPRKRRPINASV